MAKKKKDSAFDYAPVFYWVRTEVFFADWRRQAKIRNFPVNSKFKKVKRWFLNPVLELLFQFLERRLGIYDLKGFSVQSVRFPSEKISATKDDEAAGFLYVPSVFQEPRAVILLPGLFEGYSLTRILGAYFAKHGLMVFELKPPYDLSRRSSQFQSHQWLFSDLERFKQLSCLSVQETRKAIDLFFRRQGIIKVGILGISFGAICASLVNGLEKRISSAVFVLGCARVADVFWSYAQKYDLVEALQLKGVNQEVLEKEFDDFEPLNYLPSANGYRVKILRAWRDNVLPKASVKALEELYKGADVKVISPTHFFIFPLSPRKVMNELLNHFKETL